MGKFTHIIDWVDLVLFLTVGSFGLSILLSVSQELFLQQFIILIVALCIGSFVAVIEHTLLMWAAPFAYVASIMFLAVSYLGPAIRGATRWISIAGIQLQPSELVKPFLLLSFAWAMHTFPPKTVRNVALHFGLFIIPFLLVFRQPDLGSSIVYGVMWLAMMIAGGFPIRYVVLGFLVAVLLMPLGWHSLHDYQRARITTFINPGVDPRGAGYNAIQAMIAVGSGQLFGRGLGRGTQSHLRFLPEYHTDFIFATLVEELGFLGGSILLVAYGALLWRIIRPLVAGVISAVAPFVFSVGLFSMILTQIVINTGMNMGLIPITGITLPLVSFGGSSLLSLAVSYGILWSMRRGRESAIESLQ